MNTPEAPSNPKLAKLFHQHLQAGDQIRYVDDTTLVVWHQNQVGAFGCLTLILLGLITAFIVPIILLILGGLSPNGQLITYTVKRNGKIKKTSKAAPK